MMDFFICFDKQDIQNDVQFTNEQVQHKIVIDTINTDSPDFQGLKVMCIGCKTQEDSVRNETISF